jgi:hypothetical protein
MGILNLADEMGLSCIKAYKLDALKSVRKMNEARNLGVADNCSESIVTMEENSVPCHTTTVARVTNAGEDSLTTTVLQTGKQHLYQCFLKFLPPHLLYSCVHHVPGILFVHWMESDGFFRAQRHMDVLELQYC